MSSPNPQIESKFPEADEILADRSGLVEVDYSSVRGLTRAPATELLEAMSSGDIEVEAGARQAFTDCGYYEAVITRLRTSDDAAERAAAARTLGMVRTELATAYLVAGLFDSSDSVCREAAEALVNIGDPSVAPGPLRAFLTLQKVGTLPTEQSSPENATAAAQRAEQIGAAELARKEIAAEHDAALERLHADQAELHQAVADVALRRAEVQSARRQLETETRDLIRERTAIKLALKARLGEADRLRSQAEALRLEDERQIDDLQTALYLANEGLATRKWELQQANEQADAGLAELDELLENIHAAELERRELAKERIALESKIRHQAEAEVIQLDEIRQQLAAEEMRVAEATRQAEEWRNRILELDRICSELEMEAREQSLRQQRLLHEAQGWAGVASDLRELIAAGEERRRAADDVLTSASGAATESIEAQTLVASVIDVRSAPDAVADQLADREWEISTGFVEIPAGESIGPHPESETTTVVEQSWLPAAGDTFDVPAEVLAALNGEAEIDRAAALLELARLRCRSAFRLICDGFDDTSLVVHIAAARALCELEPQRRAEFFAQAIEEGSPERALHVNNALVASGLAAAAVEELGSEDREGTYDALCLLFAMAKAGEIDLLTKAIEEHANVEVRRAAIKLLTLSGHSGNAEAAVKRRLMLRPNASPSFPLA